MFSSVGRTLLLLVTLASVIGPLRGQEVATARVEENFRAEPNGVVVARVSPGTRLSATRVRGGWVEVELEGWVWAESLQATGREGRDLVVSVAGGENLRARPQGTVVARLSSGALLDELGRRPGWVRVRRVGWIWLESVTLAEERDAAAGGGGAGEAEGSFPGGVAESTDAPAALPDTARGSAGAEDGPDRADGMDPDRTARDEEIDADVLTVPEEGLAVLSVPDGDTLARARSGGDLQVLGRERGWARIRLDGWVWLGTGASADEETDTTRATAGPEAVVREPERYRGRLVTWSLRFVSLERAERVRTDFYEGEPFLLTRPPEPAGVFVYVAIPPERLSEVEDLTPLEPIEVLGRIRVGASSLTGSPILDLVELRRPQARRGGEEAPGGSGGGRHESAQWR